MANSIIWSDRAKTEYNKLVFERLRTINFPPCNDIGCFNIPGGESNWDLVLHYLPEEDAKKVEEYFFVDKG